MEVKVELADQNATIMLTQPEAVVLFGLLTRYDEKSELNVSDKAEQLLLWRLFGALKPALRGLLAPNPTRSVELARETVQRLS